MKPHRPSPAPILALCLAMAALNASALPAPPQTAGTPTPAPAAPSIDSALLSQYHWQLSTATDINGKRIDVLFARPDRPIRLNFAEGRLRIGNVCNVLGAGYSVVGGRLQLTPMVHTMMMCANPSLMAMESAINGRLHDHPRLSLQADGDAPRLRLATDSGDTLVFVGEPTAETRYGSAGEIEFLEVAAQTVPCSHPLIPDKPCLQVRELHYDQRGLKVGTPGPWHPLYQDIEGYTHEPDERDVLRVKRYAIKNPAADAPSSAYVLDSVIESEAAGH